MPEPMFQLGTFAAAWTGLSPVIHQYSFERPRKNCRHLPPV